MTRDEIQKTVLETLGQIAPEADLSHLQPQVNLREQLDIDSMDFLNFVIALDKKLGVEVPEVDYPKLATLAGCVEYGLTHIASLRGAKDQDKAGGMMRPEAQRS